MTGIVGARTGLLAATALVVGLLGPCLCGPVAVASQPEHGCCPDESGPRVSAPACCSGCVTLAAPDSALLREAPASVGVPATVRIDAPHLHLLAVRLTPPPDPPVVLTPPTILRV